MRQIARRIAALAAAAALAASLAAPGAQALDTPARAAIVVDLTSGAVLLEKNADEPLPPASMSKLMTLNMVFEALEEGRLTLEDRFPVSEKAWKMGGSKMFVRVGDRIRVADLLMGVTVQSGNDACVVLAEGLAGTEEAFAEQMNRRAAEIGLTDSHFLNATGWPDEGHLMSVRDLARLAERIVTKFPEHYRHFSIREFTWEDITQRNRNPLLDLGLGVDGMKTGHTEAAGYGLTASAERDGRRIVMVVAGLDSVGQRKTEAEKIVGWAFREFRTGVLYAAGQPIVDAQVWVGDAPSVGLAPVSDVVVTTPFAQSDAVSARIVYDGPVPAPIAAGDVIAQLIVEAPEMPPVAYPLAATADVGPGGLLARVEAAARLLLRASASPDGAAE
ncbi:MAG: D-alanyl-D-alanine carboxypeptidase family protein [Rubrimonas sp.]|uniref:D-alanyl-D-alanine carboxypeptidase family protein n=1 Tax=Rubrimonas sp. TaxID=2036015 RepID=UPI002FDCA8F0